MRWYNCIASFFAGVFLIHIIPHMTHGFSLTFRWIAIGLLSFCLYDLLGYLAT
jgi:hypothetical protein